MTEDDGIILVFDCSPDDGWERICRECQGDERVKGIRLSRNFGQHYAITAGLGNASGEWGVVMDCDRQDQPEEIVRLYMPTGWFQRGASRYPRTKHGRPTTLREAWLSNRQDRRRLSLLEIVVCLTLKACLG